MVVSNRILDCGSVRTSIFDNKSTDSSDVRTPKPLDLVNP